MEKNVRALIAERDRLMRECERLGCTVFPSKANFFLLRPPASAVSLGERDRRRATELYQTLLEKHRLVVRRFAGRPGLENLLRISVGSPEHNDLFLSSLAELLP